jgi:hypothetical protein
LLSAVADRCRPLPLAVNVRVQLIVLKGAGHGGPAFTSPESRRRIEAFFTEHLKRPAGNF